MGLRRTGQGGRDRHSSDPGFLRLSFRVRVPTLCTAAVQVSFGRFNRERCLLACPLALWMSKGFWSPCSPSASEFSKKSLLLFSFCEEVLRILIQVDKTSFTFIFPYPYLRVACSWHMCF